MQPAKFGAGAHGGEGAMEAVQGGRREKEIPEARGLSQLSY